MRTKKGVITSAKMQNTVTVTVHRSMVHPLYQKRYRSSKKFLADSNGQTDLGIGDEVVITECRPISKRKCFRVTEVLKRAPRVSEMVEEAALLGTLVREKIRPDEKTGKTETTQRTQKKAHSDSSSSSASSLSSPSSR